MLTFDVEADSRMAAEQTEQMLQSENDELQERLAAQVSSLKAVSRELAGYLAKLASVLAWFPFPYNFNPMFATCDPDCLGHWG